MGNLVPISSKVPEKTRRTLDGVALRLGIKRSEVIEMVLSDKVLEWEKQVKVRKKRVS